LVGCCEPGHEDPVHKTQGDSCAAEKLSAYHKGLCSAELCVVPQSFKFRETNRSGCAGSATVRVLADIHLQAVSHNNATRNCVFS